MRNMTRGANAMVEVIRLAVVVIVTGLGFALGPVVDGMLDRGDALGTRLLTSVLGALLGYLLGGAAGRILVRSVDLAQEHLSRVEAPVLIASLLSATLGGLLSLIIVLPLLLLPPRIVLTPLAIIVLALAVYGGGRVGAGRAGDLMRFVGVRGRLQVNSPSRGSGVKIVDTSALMDGRLIEVARAAFLEGTLVVPVFVLHEMQGMADVEEPRRRAAARRGLETLRTLQEEGLVPVEITQEDPAGIAEVDAKLAAMCRDRGAALVTVDGNLARVAEIAGIRVLNLHALAEALRPPVIPGQQIRLQIVRTGRDAGQGVGYLSDGTMVVVERAADEVGSWIEADVTSILQSRQGRMLFAALASVSAAEHG